jgi:hypothetical protein
MQETKIRTPAEDRPPPRSGWIRLVAMLGVGALLIGTLYGVWQAVASSDDPGETVPDTSVPDFSLTDEQAIQTFQRLSARARTAVAERDLTLLPTTFTSNSPMRERTKETIGRLRRDRVVDRSEFRSVSFDVVGNSGHEIEIHEQVLVDPCYESDAGEDITQGPASFEYGAQWILQFENDRWLIHESVVDGEEKVINDKKGSC